MSDICMTMAIAAITMKASTQPDIELLTETYRGSRENLRCSRFALVGVFAGFNGFRESVLLTVHDFLAAFEKVFSAFAQFASLALRVVAAFISLARQILTCIFAGFWRKKNAYDCSDAETN